MITGILISGYDALSLRGVAAHWPVTQDGFRRRLRLDLLCVQVVA